MLSALLNFSNFREKNSTVAYFLNKNFVVAQNSYNVFLGSTFDQESSLFALSCFLV